MKQIEKDNQSKNDSDTAYNLLENSRSQIQTRNVRLDILYQPTGPAKEYSPLAVNLCKSCSHLCCYCYGPAAMRISPEKYAKLNVKKNVIDRLRKDTIRFQSKKRQVLMNFIGDPYTIEDIEPAITRQALQLLLENDFPVAILTKGGNRCLRDFDLFLKYKDKIKVGATLTCLSDNESLRYEPGAALWNERMAVLRRLHNEGIKTWVSLEPVLNPVTTLQIIRESYTYVDEFKVGRWNHNKIAATTIDWHKFLVDAVSLLRGFNSNFYIKDDLNKYANGFKLDARERNADLYHM